MFRLKPQD